MSDRGSIHKWVDTAAMIVGAAAVVWVLVLRPAVESVGPAAGRQDRVRSIDGTIARARLSIGGGAPWETGRPVVVEAVDYECPACRGFERTVLPELERHLGQTVTFAYLNLPLESHPHALEAALAVECAGAQGRFLAMHDELLSQPLAEASSLKSAQQIGLDMKAFHLCLASDGTRADVDADVATVKQLVGRLATPTFLLGWARADGGVNVVKGFAGSLPPEAFRTEVEKLAKNGPSE